MQLGAGSDDITFVVLYPAGVFLCIGSRLLAFSRSFIIARGFQGIETMIHTVFHETGRGLDG